MMMTRRDYLTASGIALGGLAMSGARGAGDDGRYVGARLSLNENPFGPSPSALAAIQSQFGRLCRYVDESADVLTPAIVKRETVSADQIVLGEILEVLGLFLAKDGASGGEFIYSQPGYTALVDAVGPGGGVAVAVPLNHEQQNDLPAIASKVSARTRAIYLVNPHNPSGTVSDAIMFRNFVREMSRTTTVIVDEAYLEFEPDFTLRTVVDLTRAGENVVVFRTFSKIYSLAGLSVGYAVAPTKLAKALKYVRIGSPDTFTLPVLTAAAASLADPNYLEATRTHVIAEREKWNELFQSMKIRHSDSRGNFVFFETGRPHSEIAAALQTRGIEIGRSFPPLERWARISIGLPHENTVARRAVAELLG
jgi:histidinol-phosphate aminotransferase